MAAFGTMGGVHAAEIAPQTAPVAFNTTFLQTSGVGSVDFARFARGNVVSPGVYPVDIWLNGVRVAQEDIRFVAPREGESARACLPDALLRRLGVDFAKVSLDSPQAAADRTTRHDVENGANRRDADLAGSACVDLTSVVPDASVDFDFGEQKLNLSVPQKYMTTAARGYVPPEMWQDGVNAGFISYNANAYRTAGAGVHSTNSYLGLNAGLNLGAWHFRHQSSVSAGTGQKTQTDNIATYLQHDLTKLRSQATLGYANTTGDVFDSVAFRGAQIATDDRMLPESLRGYAPIVRGVAESNARVTVRQNGQVIYETSVSPGPFEIKDLYATGYNGNLNVTITEADGRTKTFSVPYASVAQSLRPGTTRFSVTAGQLRNQNLEDNPNFTQFTIQRGLTNLLTGYGGAVAANGYMAANLGVALNTRYGAFSTDVTGAQTQVPEHGSMRGTSLRIGYSKFIDPTNTNVAIAAYRFSTAGYLNLADAASVRDIAKRGGDIDSVFRERARVQITVNQNFKSAGTVFLSASTRQYWNRGGSDTFYQAGYTNSFKYGTYSLTASRTRDMNGRPSSEYFVSTTIPLGHSQHAPLLTTTLSHSTNGSSTAQANVSGSLGADNQFSYNGYGSYAHSGGDSGNMGVSGVYRSPYAQLSASASGGSGSSQVSVGVSGSVVAHPGGVTFSQTVGDTFGIVEASGAAGAKISSAAGVKVDGRGYAVVPYLTPYGMNTVDIDPKGTSTDVEFVSTSEQAVPRLGSVVLLKYKMVSGRAALVRAPLLGDQALPFGADVTDEAGHTVGVVAQDSRIFARGLENKGSLFVTWGEAASEQCRIDYVMPRKAANAADVYTSIEGHCLTGDAAHAVSPAGSSQADDASRARAN